MSTLERWIIYLLMASGMALGLYLCEEPVNPEWRRVPVSYTTIKIGVTSDATQVSSYITKTYRMERVTNDK